MKEFQSYRGAHNHLSCPRPSASSPLSSVSTGPTFFARIYRTYDQPLLPRKGLLYKGLGTYRYHHHPVHQETIRTHPSLPGLTAQRRQSPPIIPEASQSRLSGRMLR